MGVDAEIHFRTGDELTDKQIKDLSFDLADAFGQGSFFDYDKKGLFVTRSKKSPYYYKISTMWRYYGLDYNRGPLYSILNVCDFLKRQEYTTEVLYGNDCGGVMVEMTDKYEEELLNWFVDHGHKHYRGTLYHNLCPECSQPMHKRGWSRDNGDIHGCICCDFKERFSYEEAVKDES